MNSRSFSLPGMIMAAMLIVFSHGASAADFEMSVFPDQVSVCPCSAITPQNLGVSLTNLRGDTDSYILTMTVPTGWKNSQIQKDITLAPGEEGTLDLFLINVGCSTPPGSYQAIVEAR